MESALNRQVMQGEVNPLFQKFVREGDNPTTYIPADKRREIYDYMSKTNFTKHLESKYPWPPISHSYFQLDNACSGIQSYNMLTSFFSC